MEEWTLSEKAYELRVSRAQVACEKAYSRKPRGSSWGFFSYGDGSPMAGGGVGGFLWFPSREAMLRHVGRHMVFYSPGPTSVDPGRVSQQVAAIVERVLAGETALEPARKAINRAMKGFSQFTWWGTFDELTTGKGAFPKKMRQWHHENNEENSTRPLTKAELAGFREAIVDYGL